MREQIQGVLMEKDFLKIFEAKTLEEILKGLFQLYFIEKIDFDLKDLFERIGVSFTRNFLLNSEEFFLEKFCNKEKKHEISTTKLIKEIVSLSSSIMDNGFIVIINQIKSMFHQSKYFLEFIKVITTFKKSLKIENDENFNGTIMTLVDKIFDSQLVLPLKLLYLSELKGEILS